MTASDLPSTLHYSNDNMHGYRRKAKGEEFIYLDEKGNEVKSIGLVQRINELVIPPQWQNVWICKDGKGHIQAVGRDAKGRKQYIYHPLWKEHITQFKYNNLINFAKKLPKIREKVEKDLRKRTWTKEKVVALAIRLMDELSVRVGNKKYQKENGTYGLTTLRKKHIKESKNGLTIKYKAKSGKLRELNVEHPVLIKLLKQCSELPGYEVFRYISDNKYATINSQDINDYLREVTSQNITAKNFRTWGGTVKAIKLASKADEICKQSPRRNRETTLVRLVANELNNTVSVCRKYYIHPAVIKSLSNGAYNLIQRQLKRKSKSKWFSTEEKIVLKILKEQQSNIG
jgi:DNA topoisomerase-1